MRKETTENHFIKVSRSQVGMIVRLHAFFGWTSPKSKIAKNEDFTKREDHILLYDILDIIPGKTPY